MDNVLLSNVIDFLRESTWSISGFTEDFIIRGIAPKGRSAIDLIDWVHPRNSFPQKIAEISRSRLIICSRSIQFSRKIQEAAKVLIHVDDPYYTIATIGNRFFVRTPIPVIHESARISDTAKIGANVAIGANAFIGECVIGNDCIIGENVVIRDCVFLGNNVTIKSGAILGDMGFNFINDKKGGLIRFPQIGNLIIGDCVDIGSHTCIDRGAFSDTIIGDNVKIYNLCHIAHNVQISEKTIIAAHVVVSGSTNIGSKVWVGPNSTFRGHQTIGDGVFIGAGANVVCDVPEHEVWVGNPARFMRKNDRRSGT